MPSYQRQKIVEDLETVLGAISIAGGFQTDVTKVERVIRHWDEVNDVERPWIGFMPSREKLKYQPSDCIRVVLPVKLLAYVDVIEEDTTAGQADRTQKINDILGDVNKALNADQTRGGNATSTTVTSADTDEGEDCGVGVVQMDFEVVYFTTASGSVA